MEHGTTITAKFQQFINSQDFVSNPQDGYFHFDVIAEAYEKGFKAGEKQSHITLQEEFDQLFYAKSLSFTEYALDVISMINYSTKFHATKLFLKHSISNSKAIIFVEPNPFDDLEFIAEIYAKINTIETCAKADKEIHLEISILGETNNVNLKKLHSDGFKFQYDLMKSELLEISV